MNHNLSDSSGRKYKGNIAYLSRKQILTQELIFKFSHLQIFKSPPIFAKFI